MFPYLLDVTIAFLLYLDIGHDRLRGVSSVNIREKPCYRYLYQCACTCVHVYRIRFLQSYLRSYRKTTERNQKRHFRLVLPRKTDEGERKRYRTRCLVRLDASVDESVLVCLSVSVCVCVYVNMRVDLDVALINS